VPWLFPWAAAIAEHQQLEATGRIGPVSELADSNRLRAALSKNWPFASRSQRCR